MNTVKKRLRQFSIVFGLLLLGASPGVAAQNETSDVKTALQPARPVTLAALLALYPTGSIHAMETAKRAMDDADKVRTAIDAQFVRDQNVCFPKFFANACLEEAKERHRAALAQVRPIEIEANKFKRQANVMERDKALAEKRDKQTLDLSNPPKEALNQGVDKTAEVGPAATPSATSNKVQDRSTDNRAVNHQSALKRRQAAEAEDAKQRASNISAYEKKVQESEARQRKIAAKKLEKQRARSAKGGLESN